MKIKKLKESISESISSQEPVMKFSGRSSHTFTKDKKWEVDFDEKGNIVARTRKGKPQYFKGHINDKTNSFPSTDEDNIILAAREQHSLKFGKGSAVKESIDDFKIYGDEETLRQLERDLCESIDEDVPMEYTDSANLKALADEDEYYNEQRARRKRNFELLHKIFDSHGYRDSEERWTDKVFNIFKDAEEITVVDDASKVPSKTNDGQKVKYVISTPDAEVDVHMDAYGDYVWVVTKQTLNEDDWRDRKSSIDKEELDKQVNLILNSVDLNGRIPKIMKRHYKPNFVRYDIGIGSVGCKEVDSYETNVALPAFEEIKSKAQDNGWKVVYATNVGMRDNLSWTDFYVQLRIPYTSKSIGESINEDLSGKYSDKFRQFIRNYTDSASIVSLVDDIVRYAKEDDLKDLYFERGYDALEDDEEVDYDLTESFNEKDILNKLDQFKSQITIKPEDEKALKDILLKKNISFKIDDSKEDKLTFKLKYKKPIKEGFEEDVQTVQRYIDTEIPDMLISLSEKLSDMYPSDVEILSKQCRSFYNICESLVQFYNRHSNLEEDLTDVATATLNGPVEGPQFGLTELINTAMQNELETVNEYNTLALNARSEGFEDIANVIDEINTEENKHIGQLQELLKTISPNAEAIEVGKVEGEQQIEENIETVNKSEKTPNTNDEEVLEEDTMNDWQSIYDKFKQIEKDLNGDGEAITAVIDNMYNDNKGNPAYETAYKKWADGAAD